MSEKQSNFLSPTEPLKKEEETARSSKAKHPPHKSMSMNLGGGFIPAGPSEQGNPAVLILGTLCVALSLVLLVYGGVLWYQNEQKAKLQTIIENITKVNADIADIEKKQGELGKFQNRLGNVKTALDNHIYITKLLSKIEDYTLPNVFYTNISVAQNMAVSLSAAVSTSPDGPGAYTTLGKQLLAFEEAKEFVASAQVDGATAVIGQQGETLGINFAMTLTIKPEIVRKQIEQKK